jgi:hypothetical protein
MFFSLLYINIDFLYFCGVIILISCAIRGYFHRSLFLHIQRPTNPLPKGPANEVVLGGALATFVARRAVVEALVGGR